MLSNTWFLVGCAVFAVGGLISIIVGAVMPSTAAIVIGSLVLIVSAGLFISGLYDRKHIPGGRRRAVT
jgi:hypothetical protein